MTSENDAKRIAADMLIAAMQGPSLRLSGSLPGIAKEIAEAFKVILQAVEDTHPPKSQL